MSEKPLQFVRGKVTAEGGEVAPARFYYGDGEAAPVAGIDEVITEGTHTRWVDADGVIGIRRGMGISVGAKRAYAEKYDAVDWN